MDAPVTLVEYGDYECPYCGRAHPVLEELRERFGDRLRVVFRHFPLSELHPRAMAAALAAESAADHGRFWDMHDTLFRNQLALSDSDLASYAESMGVSLWSDVERHRERVMSDMEGGERSGVGGTPTFFINGEPYEGAHDVPSMSAAIEAALREQTGDRG
ncbi:DsbA family protein [Actinomadura keratinilytica]